MVGCIFGADCGAVATVGLVGEGCGVGEIVGEAVTGVGVITGVGVTTGAGVTTGFTTGVGVTTGCMGCTAGCAAGGGTTGCATGAGFTIGSGGIEVMGIAAFSGGTERRGIGWEDCSPGFFEERSSFMTCIL